MKTFEQFKNVWLLDFEFGVKPGENPNPVCMVAHNLSNNKKIRLFRDELKNLAVPPFDVGEDSLFVAYFSTAELSCFHVLGWPLPTYILDLYVEFKNLVNGKKLQYGYGILGALAYYGLDSISVVEKKEMRELALREDYIWSKDEEAALLDYCESDVLALIELISKMLPKIDLQRALIRGSYMCAVSVMENTGIPIDVLSLEKLRGSWEEIKNKLILEIDSEYGVFEGQSFKRDRFSQYIKVTGIAWPKLESGQLDLSDDAFKQMSKTHPQIAPLRELRGSLSRMRLSEIPVGADGRNRCLLSPFQSRTGRNQPSNNKFIFGPSTWLRSLIRSSPGYGVAYIDWSQQEFGIAAALSKDKKMKAAYESGDPYLTFAIQAGAAPPNATKKSHEPVRELYKQCILAVQYGMGEDALAVKISQPPAFARELLRLHRETYPVFWAWSDSAVDHAMLLGSLNTTFGWTIYSSGDSNPRFLRNFPMQANGAEMLRLACTLAVKRGVKLCAPIHDAILIEAPLGLLDQKIREAQSAMAEASRIILDGFTLNTEVKIFPHPQRYTDKRGERMWNTVWKLIGEILQAKMPSLDASASIEVGHEPVSELPTRPI